MEPSIRELSYTAIRPQRLAIILNKLAAGAQTAGVSSKADRRRAEADQVARMR